MRGKATKGVCALCGKEYARAGMAKHLPGCLRARRQAAANKGKPCFLLLVKTRWASPYWLVLQVSAAASLDQLDGFLRRLWLECCGHLSAFRLGRQELPMSRKLATFMRPGLEIDYDYDFGTTTELRLVVVDEYEGLVAPRRPIELLARNQPPLIVCDECGDRPATRMCALCAWEGEGWLCETCAELHVCDDDDGPYFLPLVNSPRAGVCAYTGE